jgi:hypothetical protein
LLVGEETAFRHVLLVVRGTLLAEDRVALDATLDLETEAFRALREGLGDHALEVVVAVHLALTVLSLTVLTPLTSRWLSTGSTVFLTPVLDHLLTLAFVDRCRIEAWRTYGSWTLVALGT